MLQSSRSSRAQEVTIRLRAANTAFGFVNDIADLARHPALRRIAVDTPSGLARIVAPAAMWGDGPPHLGAVPAIGEHSTLIRNEFQEKAPSRRTEDGP